MTTIHYTTLTRAEQPDPWTREQFIEDDLGGGRLSREEWDRYLVAVECDCGEDYCHGWRAMPRTEWKREQRAARKVAS